MFWRMASGGPATKGRLSGCRVEPVEDKRRAPDLTGLEAPDPTVYADRGAVLVEIDDDALDAVQVPGAGLAIDANTVADVEPVERLGRAGRLQQVMTRLYRFCDRCAVRVELRASQARCPHHWANRSCRLRGPRRQRRGPAISSTSSRSARRRSRWLWSCFGAGPRRAVSSRAKPSIWRAHGRFRQRTEGVAACGGRSTGIAVVPCARSAARGMVR